mgnify:FL=1
MAAFVRTVLVQGRSLCCPRQVRKADRKYIKVDSVVTSLHFSIKILQVQHPKTLNSTRLQDTTESPLYVDNP